MTARPRRHLHEDEENLSSQVHGQGILLYKYLFRIVNIVKLFVFYLGVPNGGSGKKLIQYYRLFWPVQVTFDHFSKVHSVSGESILCQKYAFIKKSTIFTQSLRNFVNMWYS